MTVMRFDVSALEAAKCRVVSAQSQGVGKYLYCSKNCISASDNMKTNSYTYNRDELCHPSPCQWKSMSMWKERNDMAGDKLGTYKFLILNSFRT